MLSKILISVDEKNQPCLKVSEPFLEDVTDVRDLLVIRLRENLGIKSETFTVEIITDEESPTYLLKPVTDELSYLKERLKEYINDSESMKTIDKLFSNLNNKHTE